MNCFTATQYMYTNVYYHKTARIIDFMISEAMSMIPDFINKLIIDEEEFFDTDDFNFTIKVKNQINNSDSNNNYRKAYQILNDVRARKLKYANILRFPITLAVSSNKEKELVELQTKLETKYHELSTKVDFTAKVKPIRVDTDYFLAWMRTKNIWDESSHQPKRLDEYSKLYFDMLVNMQILFHIYIDRTKEDNNQKKELLREAKEELEKLQII